MSLMLLSPGSLELPMPPAKIFGRDATVALEVGFGGGGFLAHLASAHPDWNLLGAELSLAAVSRAFRRLRRSGATNARLFRGHARFLLRDVLPDQSLHRVYVNFPDPWPKERHQNNRLLQKPFFELIAARLDYGGALLLTTDHEDYFAFALAEARKTTFFKVEEDAPPPATLETKYARKWKAYDKSFFHARFTVQSRPSASPPRLIEKTSMHHAVLDGELPDIMASTNSASKQQSTFEKQVHRIDGRTVVLQEAFQSASDERVLIRSIIQEPDLRQDVMIEIRPSRTGLLVGVAPFGNPLTTRGTSDAVRLVAEWLVGKGLTLVEEKY